MSDGSTTFGSAEGVLADAISAAVTRCPAVVTLDEGGTRAVATYLPGRRVAGIRIEEHRVLVSVVLRYGVSIDSLTSQVRAAVAPLAQGRTVDVHVADVQTHDEPHPRPVPDALAQG